MSERMDEEIKQIVSEASGEPRADVKARALEAMREASPRPAGSRLRWLPTAAGVALVAAALALAPYEATRPTTGPDAAFAAQEALVAATSGEMPAAPAGAERDSLSGPRGDYAERAAAFVEEHYPDDAEMLIAAGILARDLGEASRLLELAVEKSDSGAAWAAYAEARMESGPRYGRCGTWGDCSREDLDPADSEAVAEVGREFAEKGTPEKLTPEEAEPMLDVLRQWQRAEPENALPLAYEMYYLYGLHLDQEALVGWEKAASLPEVNSHTQEFIWYTTRLLEEMGAPSTEAVSLAAGAASAWHPVAWLGNCARIGVYEGRLAELEGRDQEAIQWWVATFRFGEHMGESADTLADALAGINIQGIGGWPVWQWSPDSITGIPDGPLLGGRLFYGESHEFFVGQAGAQAAEEIRDSMARAKVRSSLAREYTQQFLLPTSMSRAVVLRLFVAVSVLLLLAALLGFGAVSVWRRRRADEATSLSWRRSVVLTVVSLTPLVIGWIVTWRAAGEAGFFTGPATWLMLGGAGLYALLLLVLPFAVAFRSRSPEARVVTAWRGNLRRVLPLAAVGLALISLGLVGASRTTEARWVQDWMSETEIERVVATVGPEWTNPTIPADAWRSEPVPEVTSG